MTPATRIGYIGPCASASRSTPGPTSSGFCSPARVPGPAADGEPARPSSWRSASTAATLILLYGASTLLSRRCPSPADRLRPLRTLDHIAIYFLIAGTYTPVAAADPARTVGGGAARRDAGPSPRRAFRSRSASSTPRSGSRPPSISAWGTSRCWRWCRSRGRSGAGLGVAGRGRTRVHHRRGHLSPASGRTRCPGASASTGSGTCSCCVGSGCHFAFMVLHVVPRDPDTRLRTADEGTAMISRDARHPWTRSWPCAGGGPGQDASSRPTRWSSSSCSCGASAPTRARLLARRRGAAARVPGAGELPDFLHETACGARGRLDGGAGAAGPRRPAGRDHRSDRRAR